MFVMILTKNNTIALTFPNKFTRQYVNDSRKIMVKTTRRRKMRITAAYHILFIKHEYQHKLHSIYGRL